MEKQRIADCFSYVSRGKSPKYTEQSSIKVINQACIYWDRINFEKIKYHDVNYGYSTAIVNEQDLLMNSTGTGTLGRAVVFHAPDDSTYIADSHVTIMRPHHHIDPAYFAYYFSFQKIQDRLFRTCVSGSTNQIELSKEKLLAFQVDVPNLVEQQIVTRKLDKISDLIALRKQQLAKLDELIKARFVEMFGNVLAVNNLPVVQLSELVEIGSSKRIYADEYVDEGVPFYRSKEIRELGTGLKPSVELFIKQERYDEIKEKYGVPKVGDILIAAIGATIGYSWIVDTDKPFYYKDGNLLILSIKDNVNPIYLNHLMSILIDDFKNKGAAGSAQLALTIEKLEKMQVINPDINLQNQFATFVEQTDKSKLEIQTALTKLETLKKALMQQYFG